MLTNMRSPEKRSNDEGLQYPAEAASTASQRAREWSLMDVQATKADVLALVSDLDLYGADEAFIQGYGLRIEFLDKVKRGADQPLDLTNRKQMAAWRSFAELALAKLSPMVEELKAVRRHRLEQLDHVHGLSEIDACDRRALELLPEAFSPQERLEVAQKLELLKTGKEKSRKYRGAAGSMNAPSERVFEDGEGKKVTAFGKERLKEAAYRIDKVHEITIDATGNETVEELTAVFQRSYDPRMDAFGWEEFDPRTQIKTDDSWPDAAKQQAQRSAEEHAERLQTLTKQLTSEGFKDAAKKHLAAYMGLEEAEAANISYDNSAFNARPGVPPGEATIREWGTSIINLALGFKVIPLTVVRAEPNAKDIASVQEAVPSVDPRVQARELLDVEMAELFVRPPAEWSSVFPESKADNAELIKSLVRMAVFAYLVGDLDGIGRNCMIDPVTKKMMKIDNGLSFGLFEEPVVFDASSRGEGSGAASVFWIDKVRSAPLEIVWQHDLALDEGAHIQVKNLSAALGNKNSKEYKQFVSVFGLMFKSYGEAMVTKKLAGFMDRLKKVADLGKPPKLREFLEYEAETKQDAKKLAERLAQQEKTTLASPSS